MHKSINEILKPKSSEEISDILNIPNLNKTSLRALCDIKSFLNRFLYTFLNEKEIINVALNNIKYIIHNYNDQNIENVEFKVVYENTQLKIIFDNGTHLNIFINE